MPIQEDQTARVMEQEAEVHAAGDDVMADDMRAILHLIAAQLEDTDRRQSEVLGDMHRRLAEMSNEARQTRAKVPAAFAPAFERIQDGIAQLAGLVASADLSDAANKPVSSDGSAHHSVQPTDGAIGMAEHSDQLRTEPAPFSSVFPVDASQSGFSADDEFEASAEDMMITDNAADRFDLIGEEEPNELVSDPASVSPSVEATQPVHVNRTETPVFATEVHYDEEVHAHADENWDELAPWNREQAEALTRVYEVHDAEDDARAAHGFHAAVPQAAMFAGTQAQNDEPFNQASQSDCTPGKEDIEMLPHETDTRNTHQVGIANVAPVIEQAWLEERFAEIAAKIEESIFELREDQALNSLNERFGEFEERVGLALEDVATRQDFDSLKSAEAQIDSMVEYFERVETQLGRIDTLEGQMDALLNRFSDDNLMQLFAKEGGSVDGDYSSVAEAAAESVAQRFLADFSEGALGAQGENAAIGDMREALESFITERRERDEEAAGMLDTIQQALIRVLDRVEVLEAGDENPPMVSPLDDDFVTDDAPAADLATDDAPIADFDFDEPRVEPQRPEPDYSQTRLEYPAAVRDNPPADAPQHATPSFDESPDFSLHEQDVEAFDDDAFADVDQSQVDEPAHQFDITQDGPVAPLADMQVEPGPVAEQPAEPMVEHHAEPELAWEPEAQAEQSVSPIDRLRQEFIADARRAREHAAQQALMAEAEGKEQPAKKKISVPGLSSLGAKVRGVAKSRAPAKQSAATGGAGRAQVIAGDDSAPSRSRFAIPRSKILVGAVIVLFATAGALLMMRSPSKPIAEASPAAVQQTFEEGTSGPQLSGPEESAPAIKTGEASDRRGSLEDGRVYDGEFNYDVPVGTEGRPLAQALPGVSVADLDKAPNPSAVAKAQRQQRLAKMSSDLGAAAAYATPAALVPGQPVAQPAAPVPGTASRANRGNHLDLPPATVGPLSLRLAAAKGDPSAQFEVAARLAGGTGTQQDLKGAVKWYQLAAAQGFAQAQYRLGTLYERGLGVDTDLARAGVWYERAAAKGNVKAMHNLAVVSAGREVGGPDYKSAAKWFEAASKYGLSDSQFNMAVLCENGLGIEKDLQSAYVYYSLASAKGDAQAKTRREAVRAMLSNDVLEAAERRVSSFRPKRADRLVNDARVAGEDWKKRADHNY